MRSRKAPASSSATATPQRARSAAGIRAEVARGGDAGEVRLWQELPGNGRVVDRRICELLDREGGAVDREQRDAATRALDRRRVAAGKHAILARLENPARLGDQLVVGDRQRPAAQRRSDLRLLEQPDQGAVAVSAERQVLGEDTALQV